MIEPILVIVICCALLVAVYYAGQKRGARLAREEMDATICRDRRLFTDRQLSL